MGWQFPTTSSMNTSVSSRARSENTRCSKGEVKSYFNRGSTVLATVHLSAGLSRLEVQGIWHFLRCHIVKCSNTYLQLRHSALGLAIVQ